VLTGGLAACTEAAPAQPASGHADRADGRPQFKTYVALGDSYTAAPLVPVTDVANGCFRSDSNYPRLVAARLQAHLTDVSCSGADTGDITGRQEMDYGGQRTSAPPQIRAVGRDTRLVTVGIGGNDEGLFKTLIETCAAAGGASCADGVRRALGDPAQVLQEVGDNVTSVLRRVSRRAPRAEVLLVGYPRLVDEQRSCPAMPMTTADRPVLAALERKLAGTLAKAAERAGVGFVDMYAASRGHAVCSEDPWVNGSTMDQQRAAAFHPFAEGEDAIADEVMKTLAEPSLG
jgi:lysophospholipase L1-like esterase